MRRQNVEERLESIQERVETLTTAVTKIEAALVVRDPGNARSAEAYDGLRKQVAAAAGDRRRLLVLLTGLANAVDNGASTADLASLLDEACMQANAVRVIDPDHAELYEVVDGEGQELRVLAPAWVDGLTGAIVRTGTARRTSPTPPSEGHHSDPREDAATASIHMEDDSESFLAQNNGRDTSDRSTGSAEDATQPGSPQEQPNEKRDPGPHEGATAP